MSGKSTTLAGGGGWLAGLDEPRPVGLLGVRPAANGRRVGLRCSVQTFRTAAPLIALDLLAVAGAVFVAMSIGCSVLPQVSTNFALYFGPLGALSLIAYGMAGLYPGVGMHPSVEIRQAGIAGVQVVCVLGILIGAAIFHDPGPWNSELVLFTAALLSGMLTPVLRLMVRPYLSKCAWWGHPVLIFGAGPAGTRILEWLRRNPGMALRPVGILDERPADRSHAAYYRGAPQEASRLSDEEGVYWGIVAMPERPHRELLEVVNRDAAGLPHLLVVPDLGGLPSLWNTAHECGGLAGISMTERLLLPVPQISKRTLDVLVTLMVGLLLAPLIVTLAALNLLSGGPVFYCQERIGRSGRKFKAWKFRTMIPNADKVLATHLAQDPECREEWERDHKLKRDPRVTWLGHFLRKTSLDELPQLWNVLVGEMSLVGPRPIVQEEISKYAGCFSLYTRVRPGISGLWQISGRNNTTYEERVEFDRYYVRNWSPWLDLYILVCTVRTVLLGEGAY